MGEGISLTQNPYFLGCCNFVPDSNTAAVAPFFWHLRLLSDDSLADAYVSTNAVLNTGPTHMRVFDVGTSTCYYIDFVAKTQSPGHLLTDWIELDDDTTPMLCGGGIGGGSGSGSGSDTVSGSGSA